MTSSHSSWLYLCSGCTQQPVAIVQVGHLGVGARLRLDDALAPPRAKRAISPMAPFNREGSDLSASDLVCYTIPFRGLARQCVSLEHDQTLPDTERHGLGAAGSVELGKDGSDMKLDSVLGDVQPPGDSLIA